MEVNAISDYLKPNMPLPQYLPYARFLLDTDLSHTAKLLYTLLLDRATLSQKNNWMDECGFVYVIFPLSSLSDALRCSTMSIKRALRSLEDADLIERRRGHIAVPNNIFVKVPTEQKCSSAWNDSAPCDGTEMISSMEQKCSTNQRNKNDLKNNHLIKTTDAYLTFGELTTTQKQKSPSSSSKKSRIKFIMPSTVRLPPRSFTIVQMPKRNLWV